MAEGSLTRAAATIHEQDARCYMELIWNEDDKKFTSIAMDIARTHHTLLTALSGAGRIIGTGTILGADARGSATICLLSAIQSPVITNGTGPKT
jgi:hypothetical protein